MHTKKTKGFSLVELLVVITIIAILSVTAFLALGGETAKARNARRKQDLGIIQSALELYYINHTNQYPTAAQGLNELVTAGAINTVPDDPDGTKDYTYTPDTTTGYTLTADRELEGSVDPGDCVLCGGTSATDATCGCD